MMLETLIENKGTMLTERFKNYIDKWNVSCIFKKYLDQILLNEEWKIAKLLVFIRKLIKITIHKLTIFKL